MSRTPPSLDISAVPMRSRPDATEPKESTVSGEDKNKPLSASPGETIVSVFESACVDCDGLGAIRGFMERFESRNFGLKR